jgi:hypothetical protein
MTVNIPTFPAVWDSTMRSHFVACERQGFWSDLMHLRKSGLSIHLHFGGCVAAGLEATRKAYYRDGTNLDEAMCIGHDTIIKTWGDPPIDMEMLRAQRIYKSLPSAHDALEAYAERWPFDTDPLRPLLINGQHCIEVSFAVPLPITHPVTNEPILYAGRFDMLASWSELGAIWVDDEKTSNSLGRNWRHNWRLRGQFTGYVWGCRSFGVNASGVIVRGLGILAQSVTTEEVIENRPGWMVDNWYWQLLRDIGRAKERWEQMYADFNEDRPWIHWDQNLDSACSSYGGCQFIPLCQSEEPERWLGQYEKVEWNPLQRSVEE